MLTRRQLSVTALAAATFPYRQAIAQELRVLEWADLVPEHIASQRLLEDLAADAEMGFSLDTEEDRLGMSEREAASDIKSTLVYDLEDTRVKLPGYAIPISLEGAGTTEFLLAPYIGACIHVPPPPPNQIVFVRLEKPYEFDGLFDPIWVTGQMFTTAMRSELADIGYRIDAEEIEDYEF